MQLQILYVRFFECALTRLLFLHSNIPDLFDVHLQLFYLSPPLESFFLALPNLAWLNLSFTDITVEAICELRLHPSLKFLGLVGVNPNEVITEAAEASERLKRGLEPLVIAAVTLPVQILTALFAFAELGQHKCLRKVRL